MSQAQIQQKVSTVLATKSFIQPARSKRVMATLASILPKLGEISAGVVVVSVHTQGVQTCTGGHQCPNDGPSPGGPGNPDCDPETCDNQVCEDGHTCGNQSCGTEACDDGHSCEGTYKGVIDVSGMSAKAASSWTAIQAEAQKALIAKRLEVRVTVER